MRRPKGFRPAGQFQWADFAKTVPDFSKSHAGRKGARARGMKYESRAHDHFICKYGDFYLPNPWIVFQTPQGLRWAQPDALLFDFQAGVIVIMEYKLQHASRAYWQLKHLYEPLLRYMFPADKWEIRLVEVCRWYDLSSYFPVEVTRIEDEREPFNTEIGVRVWRP